MGKKRVITKSGEDTKTKQKASSGKAKGSPKKHLEVGRAYIRVSYNNTTVSITDLKGDLVAWSSAGSLGFRGPKKATAFAASKVVATVMEKVKKVGLKAVEIYVKGIGGGRETAIRSLVNQGLDVTLIKDITPMPHNGPRPPKVRRV
ncbi:MAG TPA: 30S ribosomal protein S11 [Candidatus Paceibacterota bacterium]|nr:30S ribosomal protein S11 [Candidatus Paceibacterota bacterium]